MRPVVLDSHETSDQVTGEIFVVTNYPFAAVSSGLNNPGHWCDVMSLHINTKYCRAAVAPGGTILKVNIGRKTAQSLKDASRIEFNYTTVAETATYFDIRLSARKGLLGTRDYLIELEAVPLPDGKTFLHLTYSYTMSFVAKVAVKTYLATIGSGKVGFTSLGIGSNGQLQFIGGVRALMERNTMRYYLAIDSFLAAAADTPSTQLEKRLQSWFSAVEQYPRQLHELDRAEYIAMKRDEYLRQQTTD